MRRCLLLFAFAVGQLAAAPDSWPEGLYADIETPRGVLTADLHFERAPMTVMSFVGLAEGTLGPAPDKPFFNGLTFHRVVPGFVVQGGDPLGTGEGGPGYTFPDEIVPGLRHDAAGVLSMANSGPDTNGSQFFITLRDTHRLDYLHSVFGRIVRGHDLLPRIAAGDTMKVTIRRVGAAAEAFQAGPERFAALIARAPEARLPHLDDPQGLLPKDPAWARILDHRLANFERFTGHRVLVRLIRGDSSAAATPADLASTLAARAGAGTSAVVVYQFDGDAWGWWVAETLHSRLNDTASSPLEAEPAFFAAAEQRATAVMADLPAEPSVTPERRLKLRLDEVLNALLHTLEGSE